MPKVKDKIEGQMRIGEVLRPPDLALNAEGLLTVKGDTFFVHEAPNPNNGQPSYTLLPTALYEIWQESTKGDIWETVPVTVGPDGKMKSKDGKDITEANGFRTITTGAGTVVQRRVVSDDKPPK